MECIEELFKLDLEMHIWVFNCGQYVAVIPWEHFFLLPKTMFPKKRDWLWGELLGFYVHFCIQCCWGSGITLHLAVAHQECVGRSCLYAQCIWRERNLPFFHKRHVLGFSSLWDPSFSLPWSFRQDGWCIIFAFWPARFVVFGKNENTLKREREKEKLFSFWKLNCWVAEKPTFSNQL